MQKLYLFSALFFFLSSCFILSSFAHRNSGPENEMNFIFSGMVPPSSSSHKDEHNNHPCPPCPSPSCPPPPPPCPSPSPSPTPCNACAPCTDFNFAGAEIVVGAALAPFGLDPTSQDRPGFGFEVVAGICALFNCKARFEMVKLSEILSLIDASTSTGNFNKFEKKINVLADQITVNAARDVFFDYSSVYAQAVQYLYVLPSAPFASRDAFVADAKNKVGTVVGSVFIATANTLVGADRVVLYPDFVSLTAALTNNEIQGNTFNTWD